jgi:hypothetical protein
MIPANDELAPHVTVTFDCNDANPGEAGKDAESNRPINDNPNYGKVKPKKRKKPRAAVAPMFVLPKIVGANLDDHVDDLRNPKRQTSADADEGEGDGADTGQALAAKTYVGKELIPQDVKRYKAAGLLLYRYVNKKPQLLLGQLSRKGCKIAILVGVRKSSNLAVLLM